MSMTTAVFNHHDKVLVVKTQELPRGSKHGRAYVDGARTPLETSNLQRPPASVKGDDPANDALWRRYNRVEVQNSTELLGVALAKLGLTVEQARFSRTAGCSCGCSPGFVLQHFPMEIFVEAITKEQHAASAAKKAAAQHANQV